MTCQTVCAVLPSRLLPSSMKKGIESVKLFFDWPRRILDILIVRETKKTKNKKNKEEEDEGRKGKRTEE